MAKVARFVVNRNPRNLERLCIARRPAGYHFEKDRDLRQYYYQLEFEKTNKHTSAFVKHVKDGRLLQASTHEFVIAKRLHSNTDVSAAFNIGLILARRCLQAGIHFVNKGVKDQDIQNSEKIQAFFRGIEEGGVLLKELPTMERNYDADIEYIREYPTIDETKEFSVPKLF